MMSRAKFFFVVLVAFVLVAFVMNKSISSYLQQRYHIDFFPQGEIFNEANAFKNKLEQIKLVLIDDELSINYELLKKQADTNKSTPAPTPAPTHRTPQIHTPQNQPPQNYAPQNAPYTAPQPAQPAPKSPHQLYDDEYGDEAEFTRPPKPRVQITQKLDIKANEEFLLIGDSLMQGVALALSKDLKRLGIKSTNLSKQNTGLAYKSYFDWAKAVELSFENNDKIKYLVVLLGANDPWDITIRGKTYRFSSEEWKELYTQRVDELIQIAKEYGVKILWYEIPPVKRDALNAKIQILNEIYKQENDKNSEIFIDTAEALSGGERYSSYIKNENNASIKVRADDGIHFNLKGAKIMSNLLLERLSGYVP